MVGGEILVVEGLAKRYGRVYGARSVSLRVRSRSIHGLVGPNGAGKTTTLSCIVGLARPDGGRVVFLGHDLWGGGGWRLRSLIGFVPETPFVSVDYTVLEFMEELALAEGYSRAEARAAARRALEEAGVEELSARPVKGLSKGQRKRVLFAQAMLAPRELYVLDEPFTGLDPGAVVWARELIRGMSRDAGVLVSSHLLRELEDLADTVTLIANGSTVYEGPVGELVEKTRGLVYVFRVDDPDKAVTVLSELGEARTAGNGVVEARLRSQEDAAEAVRRLVEAGVKVYEAARSRGGLEQAYLELVGPQ